MPRTTDERSSLSASQTDLLALPVIEQDNEPLPTFPDHQLDWTEIMEEIDNFAVPDQLVPNPSIPPDDLSTRNVFQERVVYAVKQIKTWPLNFPEQTNGVPFINLSLYDELPAILCDVLGMCSLYRHSNEANGETVRHCVSQTGKRLHEALTSQSQDGLPVRKQIALAQALCLYRIIALFDGDISLRSEAESTAVAFDQFLQQLKGHHTPAQAEYPPFSEAGWKSWLLSESLRRTAIAGWIIEGTCEFLKHGIDDYTNLIEMSYCVQKSIWKATTLFDWRAAAQKDTWYPARLSAWEEDTASATPEDVDELGFVVMVLVRGTDFCREWLGSANLDDFASRQLQRL